MNYNRPWQGRDRDMCFCLWAREQQLRLNTGRKKQKAGKSPRCAFCILINPSKDGCWPCRLRKNISMFNIELHSVTACKYYWLLVLLPMTHFLTIHVFNSFLDESTNSNYQLLLSSVLVFHCVHFIWNELDHLKSAMTKQLVICGKYKQ